jgi:hypothetical protein
MDCVVSQNNLFISPYLSFGRVMMSISYSTISQRIWSCRLQVSVFFKTTRKQHRHPISPTSLFDRNTAFVTPLIHQQVQYHLPSLTVSFGIRAVVVVIVIVVIASILCHLNPSFASLLVSSSRPSLWRCHLNPPPLCRCHYVHWWRVRCTRAENGW